MFFLDVKPSVSSKHPELTDFLMSKTSNTGLGFFLQNQIKYIPDISEKT